jgi:hypothetical protein
LVEFENIAEEVFLTNEANFVNINNIYYGGFQKWLYTEKVKSKFWANRSCGITAASNIIVHMSMYKPRLRSLYPYSSLSKENFIRIMKELFYYIKPTVMGIPTTGKMERGLKSFAKSKETILESRSLTMSKDIDATIRFIKQGLKMNSPVLMVTWNSKIANLRYHWVTITGYMKDIDGQNYIITSNWGEKELFSLDNLIKDNSLYRGLVYFN